MLDTGFKIILNPVSGIKHQIFTVFHFPWRKMYINAIAMKDSAMDIAA